MKKYKLIQTYPGSPKLNSIYEPMLAISIEDVKLYKHSSLDTGCIVAHIIENNPKYWEEVVEKDYEILSFISTHSMCNIQQDGKYSACSKNKLEKGHCTAEEILSLKNGYKIHSVKRLSDGEVFTVGDKVKFQGNGYSDITTILKFEFVNNKIHAHSGSANFHIKWINHIKQPLFTTDFEILSFIHNGTNGVEGNYIVNMSNGVLISPHQKLDENHYLNSKCWSINSVKRLSDNIIFKIGDYIEEGYIINIIIKNFKIYLNIK